MSCPDVFGSFALASSARFETPLLTSSARLHEKSRAAGSLAPLAPLSKERENLPLRRSRGGLHCGLCRPVPVRSAFFLSSGIAPRWTQFLADCFELSGLFARKFTQRHQFIEPRISEPPLALGIRPPFLFDGFGGTPSTQR